MEATEKALKCLKVLSNNTYTIHSTCNVMYLLLRTSFTLFQNITSNATQLNSFSNIPKCWWNGLQIGCFIVLL